MGLFPRVADLIKAENQYQPITGDLLLIGRQVIERSDMSDVQFFASFCKASIKALDVSAFEGAEITHDLCEPLPKALHQIADFIFDGSCLDNIFDPAMALRNLSSMLRPGGRMVLFEQGTTIKGSLLAFSPEWFFDFFAANGYADCQIKLGVFTKWVRDPWVVQSWYPFHPNGFHVNATPDVGNFYIYLIAQKGGESTDGITPIQAQYRTRHGTERMDDCYHQAAARYAVSPRLKYLEKLNG